MTEAELKRLRIELASKLWAGEIARHGIPCVLCQPGERDQALETVSALKRQMLDHAFSLAGEFVMRAQKELADGEPKSETGISTNPESDALASCPLRCTGMTWDDGWRAVREDSGKWTVRRFDWMLARCGRLWASKRRVHDGETRVQGPDRVFYESVPPADSSFEFDSLYAAESAVLKFHRAEARYIAATCQQPEFPAKPAAPAL